MEESARHLAWEITIALYAIVGACVGWICSRWTCRIAAIALGGPYCRFADEIAGDRWRWRGRLGAVGGKMVSEQRLLRPSGGAAMPPVVPDRGRVRAVPAAVDYARLAKVQFGGGWQGEGDDLDDLRADARLPDVCGQCRVDNIATHQRRHLWLWPLIGAIACGVSACGGAWEAIPAMLLLPATILDTRLRIAPAAIVNPLFWLTLIVLAVREPQGDGLNSIAAHALFGGGSWVALEMLRLAASRIMGRVVLAPSDVTALATIILWFGPDAEKLSWLPTGFILAIIVTIAHHGRRAITTHTPMMPALYASIPLLAAMPAIQSMLGQAG